jgi:hypothetical protein
MLPSVYLYKITFEEIPDWYWGVHKEDHPGEYYMGSPYTHAWKWNFYTPKKQILQYFEYSAEGYREAKLIEDRLIRPDLNNPLCLNENVGGQYSLAAAALGAYAVHQEKDENGKSKHAVRAGKRRAAATNAAKDVDGKCIAGKKLAAKTNSAKDERGRSLQGIKNAERMHKEKDELGRSIQGVKNAERLNREKDEFGRSVNAMKMQSQVWESLVDGYRGRAVDVSRHNRAMGEDPNARIRLS